MKTNAGSEAVGQLLRKVGLAASRQGLGEGVEFFHAFRVLLQQPFFHPLCQILRLGLRTSPGPNEHQHLSALGHSIVDHTPHRVAFQTL